MLSVNVNYSHMLPLDRQTSPFWGMWFQVLQNWAESSKLWGHAMANSQNSNSLVMLAKTSSQREPVILDTQTNLSFN